MPLGVLPGERVHARRRARPVPAGDARYPPAGCPSCTEVLADAMQGVHEFRDLHALSVALAGRVDEARSLVGRWADQPRVAPRLPLGSCLTVVRALLWLELGDRDAVAALRDGSHRSPTGSRWAACQPAASVPCR